MPFNFDDYCLATFNLLKEKLTKSLILVSPDWSLSFELMCDASDYAIGVVLGQRKDNKTGLNRTPRKYLFSHFDRKQELRVRRSRIEDSKAHFRASIGRFERRAQATEGYARPFSLISVSPDIHCTLSFEDSLDGHFWSINPSPQSFYVYFFKEGYLVEISPSSISLFMWRLLNKFLGLDDVQKSLLSNWLLGVTVPTLQAQLNIRWLCKNILSTFFPQLFIGKFGSQGTILVFRALFLPHRKAVNVVHELFLALNGPVLSPIGHPRSRHLRSPITVSLKQTLDSSPLILNIDGALRRILDLLLQVGSSDKMMVALLLVFSFFLDHATTNIEAEAYGFYKGFELYMALGFSSFCILSDSQVVVDTLHSASAPLWYLDSLFRSILLLLKDLNCTIRYIYKEANNVVDSLANYGCSTRNRHYYPSIAKLPFATRGLLHLHKMGTSSIRWT
ncbi:hypothetical protein M9H77_36330 [Catharanthus roseus]|uniref:Uncharacterized protein n=1 Tax=Catharanthus roseus TaxID=4058 RepID=A0ACB9ZSC9_CATRO|nr:hypothetical protein M9H77_36330 [Catharanthus roseus]